MGVAMWPQTARRLARRVRLSSGKTADEPATPGVAEKEGGASLTRSSNTRAHDDRRSIALSPYAAPLYEKVEDRERALDAYSWMVLAWDEADAEVQPLYRQARADLARVQGLRRE